MLFHSIPHCSSCSTQCQPHARHKGGRGASELPRHTPIVPVCLGLASFSKVSCPCFSHCAEENSHKDQALGEQMCRGSLAAGSSRAWQGQVGAKVRDPDGCFPAGGPGGLGVEAGKQPGSDKAPSQRPMSDPQGRARDCPELTNSEFHSGQEMGPSLALPLEFRNRLSAADLCGLWDSGWLCQGLAQLSP